MMRLRSSGIDGGHVEERWSSGSDTKSVRRVRILLSSSEIRKFCGCLVHLLLRKIGFVRGQHLGCSVEIASLPIIDLKVFKEGSAATKRQISQAAVDACESAGFFYVSGHGIEEQVFENAKRAALEFFRMPSENKAKVQISQFPHPRGYVGHHAV